MDLGKTLSPVLGILMAVGPALAVDRTPPSPVVPLDQLTKDAGQQVRVLNDPATGFAGFIRIQSGALKLDGANDHERATDFLDRNGAVSGLDNPNWDVERRVDRECGGILAKISVSSSSCSDRIRRQQQPSDAASYCSDSFRCSGRESVLRADTTTSVSCRDLAADQPP